VPERSPRDPVSDPSDRPDDDESLVAAFERARLVTVGEDPVMLFGPRAVDRLPWSGPSWVVTAHNPGGSRVPDRDNDRRHEALVEALRDRGVDPVDIEAGGPGWVERSVLVTTDQVDSDEVFALAERFGQHSVFELTDDRVLIVRVRDRRVVSDRPRT